MCDRENELMSAYLAGDEHAFAELYRIYAPVLLRFFRRHGKRPSDAQDLTQDTFMRLHRARADFRPGEPVRPWLFTIARNRCYDHSRRLRRRPEAFCEVDNYEAPQPAHEHQVLILAERRDALHDALAKLPNAERSLLDEHWFGERAFAEIAARDGLQSSTVRVRAYRACQRLREMISVRHSAAA